MPNRRNETHLPGEDKGKTACGLSLEGVKIVNARAEATCLPCVALTTAFPEETEEKKEPEWKDVPDDAGDDADPQ